MTHIKITRRRATAITAAWRILCMLATMPPLAAFTGLLAALPPLWLGVSLLPGVLVMLLTAVAAYAERSQRSVAASSLTSLSVEVRDESA
ncbi:hypothetical protein [Leucobacter salsicius]|uniref:hypothetical protein n=1 Tax=Leucobacter salsicius TaxID=664638 RepID=UPI0003496884|nr:hypothetical protein [Leucobacter salsicius]